MNKHKLGDFTIPAGVYKVPGKTFCGKMFGASAAVRRFLGVSPRISDRLICSIYKIDPPVSDDEIISSFTSFREHKPDSDKVCAIMAYLESPDGAWALQVPEGAKETNLVLGYLTDEVPNRALCLAHEKYPWEEEFYHLSLGLTGSRNKEYSTSVVVVL